MLETATTHLAARHARPGRALTAVMITLLWALGLGACATPATESESPSRLTATPWMLVSLAGTTVDTLAKPATLVLEPATDQLYGHAGCNRLSGSYVLDGDQLSFSRLITTKMACAQGMDQEQAFLAALAATTTFRLEQGRLSLIGDDGAVLAVLMAEPNVG
ncbi:META domain-containing protein [Abyssibacter sp.]|jgi:heat shock protein HslJ|uniref:META domain-containing protein n=1 Tax=Abyssibacter sp. TaxID=2320200 RepID=UPI003514E77D